MRTLDFTQAIDDAIGQAMSRNPDIVVYGEDTPLIRRNLLVRFGPERVFGGPISEAAFVGAGVTAAMSGLRPIVEIYMVDFLGVAMDALLNHAAKVEAFSGGRWNAPLVIRAPCGGGYGDGGQHQQSLWGWLAHIPGLTVVVPSTPADAGGLMTASLEHDGPVVFLEHKLLSETNLEFLGSGGRDTVTYDVPAGGRRGQVPRTWTGAEIGEARVVRDGADLTIVSVGVGVHRACESAAGLEADGVSAGVIDLRSVSPLDIDTVCDHVSETGRLLVVDEDYLQFGLSGEIAASVAERGVPFTFARVCTESTIPYDLAREAETLPNVTRIGAAARRLCDT